MPDNVSCRTSRGAFAGIQARTFLIAWLAFSQASVSQQSQERGSAEDWSMHFQLTIVAQGHPAFRAPYSGLNSLSPGQDTRTSLTSTFYLGRRLWKGGELYVNPEAAAGSGLSRTTGIAGFPNGEIYRVESPALKLYAARMFLRQTVPLSAESGMVEDDENTLGGSSAASRLVFTVGKISLMDIFDDNAYSHEPRTDFLNWALMGNGAWDYPADTRGYTWAFVAEYIRPGWAARFALSTVPTIANGPDFDWNLGRAHGEAIEIELRDVFSSRANVLRFFVYRNLAKMGNYRQALDAGSPPDIISTRAYGRSKIGFGLNGEFSVTRDLGAFARLGWSDGRNETWVFTEIDRTISAGCVLNCRFLGRPADRVGLAAVVNGLSGPHEEYLSAGGYGFIIGDGALQYGVETIIEAFYSARIIPELELSLDYQFVSNPAYNTDRGPVHVLAARAHVKI